MGKQSVTRGQVDVTYVKRGQVAAIITRQSVQPSPRAKAAIVRAAERRETR